MKKYYYIAAKCAVVPALLWMFAACVKDTGNYDYQPVEDMYPQVLDFSALITSGELDTLKQGDMIDITPPYMAGVEVDESNYTFEWFTVSEKGAKEIVGTERRLTYAINLPPGLYTLFLKVTNKLNTVSRHYPITFRVVTAFSEGWFVTKEQPDGTTEIDVVKYATGAVISNVISAANEGTKLPGKPVKTTLALDVYWRLDTVAGRGEILTSAFIVATQSDIWSFTGNDMRIDHKTNQMFLELPERINPTDLGSYAGGSVRASVMINDGKFYWICRYNIPSDANLGNIGKYAQEWISRNFNISPYVCKIYKPIEEAADQGGNFVDQQRGMVLFFDRNTNSFYRALGTITSNGIALDNFGNGAPPPASGIPNCQNMPYELTYMKEYSPYNGVGIMRAFEDGAYYGFRTAEIMRYERQEGPLTNPLASWVPIPNDANVTKAAIRTTSVDNNTIYSSSGDNKVYAYYNVGAANGQEALILEFPADEKVTYMEDIQYPSSYVYAPFVTNTAAFFKHLVVLTQQGENWKMYCYDHVGTSPNIIPTPPVKTYSGKGKAVHVLYTGPKPVGAVDVGSPSFTPRPGN